MHLHSPICVRYVPLLSRLELTLLLLFSDGNNHARLAVLRFRQGQLQVDRGMALTVTTMMFDDLCVSSTGFEFTRAL